MIGRPPTASFARPPTAPRPRRGSGLAVPAIGAAAPIQAAGASRSGAPGNSVEQRAEFDLRAVLQDNARMKAICPSILRKPVGPDFFQACPSCRQSKFLEFKRSEPHELLKELRIYACKFCGHELAFGRELPRHVI